MFYYRFNTSLVPNNQQNLIKQLFSCKNFEKSEDKEDKKFNFFDQSNYFISHSAMREWEWKALDTQKVFPDIYKESYKNQIMDRWIKANSNFGRYKK